jgi:far upstream element-binding protein
MGMVREAEMIEQQVKARQAGAAPAATPVSMMQQQQQQQAPAAPNGTQQNSAAAAQAQADYSAEWAEYYRSIGKMQEAEAIEKQIQASKVGVFS